MTKPFDIDYWTEEYRKCKDVPGYFVRNYMKIKEADDTMRAPTEEEAEKALLDSGVSLHCHIPEELHAGGCYYEDKFGDPLSAARNRNRVYWPITMREKKKQP